MRNHPGQPPNRDEFASLDEFHAALDAWRDLMRPWKADFAKGKAKDINGLTIAEANAKRYKGRPNKKVR